MCGGGAGGRDRVATSVGLTLLCSHDKHRPRPPPVRSVFGRTGVWYATMKLHCVARKQMGQSVQQAFDSAKTVVSNTSDATCAAEHSKFALLGAGDHNQRLFIEMERDGQ